MAKQSQVQAFLKTFQIYWAKSWELIPRRENLAALMEYGLSFNRLHETIMELTVSDYVSGPSTDHAFKHHHVWVFGIDLDGNEIYIKLL